MARLAHVWALAAPGFGGLRPAVSQNRAVAYGFPRM